MAGRNLKPSSGGFDPSEKVNSNTLKRHPKMDLSRNDLLQLLSYLEGELQARDVAIATLKAEKAKQLLYQAKYGRFGLGDPFSAMQRDSDNMKDNTFDESAIKSMYDNQLAQLENLIATQRKAQLKMREQMLAGEKRYQKVCCELDDEKRKHAQDTAQGDDVTYMLEKERERLKSEVDFEKVNVKKMEKDMKKTLASLEDERASSAKHKQVALMLIKERKTLVDKYIQEKHKADQAEKVLADEHSKSMNMAEGLVQESKKSLKMEATMERQASEFDLEREQLRNKLQREEGRNKDLHAQIETLTWQMENLHKQKPSDPSVHTVEIKSSVQSAPVRLSSDISPWTSTSPTNLLMTKPAGNIVEREAGLSPRNTTEFSVRKRDNTRYASPQSVPIERGHVQYGDTNLEQRVAPIGAVADSKVLLDSHSGHKLNVSLAGPTVVSTGGRITVQTNSPPASGNISPRRMLSVSRGTPPPIPPNKPILPVVTSTSALKPVSAQKAGVGKEGSTSKPVHIPVSVVHTTSIAASASGRTSKHEGSPSSLRKPAQLYGNASVHADYMHNVGSTNPATPESFDFLGQEMADLQQLLVSMVTVSSDTPRIENTETLTESSSAASSMTSSVTSPSNMTSSVTSPSTMTSSNMTSSSVPSQNSPASSSEFTATSQTAPLSASTQKFSSQMTATVNFRKPIESPISETNSNVSSKSPSKNTGTISISSSQASANSVLGSLSGPGAQVSQITVKRSSPLRTSIEIGENNRNHSSPVHQSTDGTHDNELNRSKSVSLRSSIEVVQNDPSGTRHRSDMVADIPASPIHRYAALGDVESLRKLIVELEADVNLPMKDGTTPAHCAAQHGHQDCLRLLLEKDCHVNCVRDNQQTPLHCAATYGQIGCLKYLLEHGGNPHLADYAGWTPLHWAACKGHLYCCTVLLTYGAKRLHYTNTNILPVQMAVHYGWPKCVDVLLTYDGNPGEPLADVRRAVSNMVDKDGLTLAHVAATKQSPECLCVILQHCDIDLELVDKWGRSAIDVASPSCQHILQPYYGNSDQMHHMPVKLQCSGQPYMHDDGFLIGHIDIAGRTSWAQLTCSLNDCLDGYLKQVDRGLRTKKILRLDPAAGTDDLQYSLGLNNHSVYAYSLGNVSWSAAVSTQPSTKLAAVLSSLDTPVIHIMLKGSTSDYDSLAFDLLLPVVFFQSFIRLLEQYKCVITYGPEGTRKKRLVKYLAKHLAEKEREAGQETRISQVYLHSDFTHADFVQLLKTEGCLLPVGIESTGTCVLLLFNMEKVQLADMLGGLAQHMEYRGAQHSFTLPGVDGTRELCYFPTNFFLIATMDKARSTGLDLGLQQRFRWVHFPVKNEPIKHLLARHYVRCLIHTYGGTIPSPEDAVFKAVEWVLCVWQRLNDGICKLGLPDVVFGPDIFMSCPIHSHNSQLILGWLKTVWNEVISPVVRNGVLKGTGKDSAEDRTHKVPNTALYVLMQRVIVPGCPLNTKEKDEYLSEFSGSNELEVPLKPDKWATPPAHRPSLHNGHQANTAQHTYNRNSTGSTVSFPQQPQNNIFKRRSHSDNALSRTDQIEIPVIHEGGHKQPVGDDIQAKVPKLEIRSPVLGLPIPLHSAFNTTDMSNPLTDYRGNHVSHTSQRRSTHSVGSKIPTPQSSKRSRSSENLSSVYQSAGKPGIGQGQFRATSPFSFSLTTPNSSLFSFKSAYTNTANTNGNVNNKSRSLTSSPTSLLYPSHKTAKR